MRCAAAAALSGPVAALILVDQIGWDRSHAIWLAWPLIGILYWGLKLVFAPKRGP